MSQAKSGQQEGQHIVQAEEAVQGRVVDAEPPPQPCHDSTTHHRNSARQAGDHRGSPQGHLSPGQHVTDEGGQDHDKQQGNTQQPYALTRLGVAAVEQATEQVGVHHHEEQRGAVGVQVPKQPAVRHVPHQVLNAGEGQLYVRRVVHGEEHPSQDLGNQAQASKHPPVPVAGQVGWRGVAHKVALDQAQHRLVPQASSHAGGRTHDAYPGTGGVEPPVTAPKAAAVPLSYAPADSLGGGRRLGRGLTPNLPSHGSAQHRTMDHGGKVLPPGCSEGRTHSLGLIKAPLHP